MVYLLKFGASFILPPGIFIVFLFLSNGANAGPVARAAVRSDKKNAESQKEIGVLHLIPRVPRLKMSQGENTGVRQPALS